MYDIAQPKPVKATLNYEKDFCIDDLNSLILFLKCLFFFKMQQFFECPIFTIILY